jgi:hypothetical protein
MILILLLNQVNQYKLADQEELEVLQVLKGQPLVLLPLSNKIKILNQPEVLMMYLLI